MTRGWLPQRAGSPSLNDSGAAAAVPRSHKVAPYTPINWSVTPSTKPLLDTDHLRTERRLKRSDICWCATCVLPTHWGLSDIGQLHWHTVSETNWTLWGSICDSLRWRLVNDTDLDSPLPYLHCQPCLHRPAQSQSSLIDNWQALVYDNSMSYSISPTKYFISDQHFGYLRGTAVWALDFPSSSRRFDSRRGHNQGT